MVRKGITLIEILIAILVFSVGILTILTVIGNNISMVDKIKNKSTATFLSKEGIELIYNIRDTNLQKGIAWNCANIDNAFECIDSFNVGKIYRVNSLITGYYDIRQTTDNYVDNLLYYHSGIIKDSARAPILSGFWYDSIPTGGSKSIFSRKIRFDGAYMEGDGKIGDVDKILKVESIVTYVKGGTTGEVVLESFIGNH